MHYEQGLKGLNSCHSQVVTMIAPELWFCGTEKSGKIKEFYI